MTKAMAAGKVLYSGLLVAAGVFAPAATMPAEAASAAPYVAQGLLNVLGSLGLGELTQASAERRRRRSQEAAALLRNHDLQLLIATALQQALRLSADEKFPGRAKEIGWLADEVEGYLRETPAEELGERALPSIVERYAAAKQEQSPIAAVEREAWLEVVRALAARAKTRQIAAIEDGLAEHLDAWFGRFVIEVFKEDATGKGPAEGKGWAALELLFWGLLRADVQGLRDGVGEARELARKHAEALKEVDGKLDRLVRWHGPAVVQQDNELRELLTSMHEGLESRLDEIADLIGHGLLTPYEFETAYWRKRRKDPGAK